MFHTLMAIKIMYCGRMYTIEKEPYETLEDTYKRGWNIIKDDNTLKNNGVSNECYSNSIMMLNVENRGMSY